jgi:hypothetical protein
MPACPPSPTTTAAISTRAPGGESEDRAGRRAGGLDRSGLTVITAIAGSYTARADRYGVTIGRGDCGFATQADTFVNPGDINHIAVRFLLIEARRPRPAICLIRNHCTNCGTRG